MEEKKSTIVEQFIDGFNEAYEEKKRNPNLELKYPILSRDELREGLPSLLGAVQEFDQNIQTCDRNIKNWQISKKDWDLRSKTFLGLLAITANNLGLSNSLQGDKAKLARTATTVLEIDENFIVDMYRQLADELQGRLPGYIKVSLTVDKTMLKKHLATDNSLALNHPDKIHTKENVTWRLAATK